MDYRLRRFAALCIASLCAVLGACGGGSSAERQLVVAGALDRPAAMSFSELVARPAATQTVNYLAGTTPQTHTYVGTSLWSLLNDAGIQTDPSRRNDILGMYVVGTGSDGYKSVVAMGEIDPTFGNQPNIIAYELDGVPLTTNGIARIVVPNDVRAGRYVSNLIAIEVFRAAPAL